jgi:alkanesulfonate monooxygenase SsuD/methylene tetrahydromethanopterin reductase-like flavin-dependent oxidoreductase (luciferase family)
MATPENIATLAQQGEAMGFGILAVTDHIIFPKSIQSAYPGGASGQYYAAGESQGEYLEPLALLSFLAGITSSAKLLTAVMVLPNRPPILTAKMLATIDVLSNGRVIVGCGAGWMREEFEALGSPPFEKRGAVVNEYIRAFKELWTQDNPRAPTVASPTSSSRPSRYRSPTRPSGPAAKVRRRCVEQGASPMVGIPSRKTCTSPWEVRSSSPRMPPESSNTRRKRGAIPPV